MNGAAEADGGVDHCGWKGGEGGRERMNGERGCSMTSTRGDYNLINN